MGSRDGDLTRTELWAAGLFPVLTGKYGMDEGAAVPLAMVLPHDRQAQRNHSQTLQRLAERGGLSCCELAAVLEDREWRPMRNDAAWRAIFAAHAAWVASVATDRGNQR